MSVDRKIVDSLIRSLGPESLPIHDLERDLIGKAIEESETILAFFTGRYDQEYWHVLVTDRRLLFLETGFCVFGRAQMEWPLGTMNALSFRLDDSEHGEIELSMGGVPRLIERILGHRKIPKLFEIISRVIRDHQRSQSQGSQVSEDVISQLERLAKLKQQGILTEKEFMQQKARILSP